MPNELRFNRAPLRALGYAFAGLFGLAVMFIAAGLRVNVTPSIPLGLYIRTGLPPAPGLVAEFCPSGMSSTESSRYRGFGIACPDRSIPLLKPIVATTGDRVEFSSQGLSVNGKRLPNTAPREFDSKGRPVRAWPPGSYTVESGTIIVASTYHRQSYDSRYLGPIRVSDLRGTLRPLWTFQGREARSQTKYSQQTYNMLSKHL